MRFHKMKAVADWDFEERANGDQGAMSLRIFGLSGRDEQIRQEDVKVADAYTFLRFRTTQISCKIWV